MNEQTIQIMTQRGLTPMQLEVKENGKSTQEVIFPWAILMNKPSKAVYNTVNNELRIRPT